MIFSAPLSSTRCARERRWWRCPVNAGRHRMSGMSYSSVSPARSPASPFGANIDSFPGQIALGHHCTRDGAHALQQRQVSAKPARALNPPTSHDDRVCQPRLLQAAAASATSPSYGLSSMRRVRLIGDTARRPATRREAAGRRCRVHMMCGWRCDAQRAKGVRRLLRTRHFWWGTCVRTV